MCESVYVRTYIISFLYNEKKKQTKHNKENKSITKKISKKPTNVLLPMNKFEIFSSIPL